MPKNPAAFQKFAGLVFAHTGMLWSPIPSHKRYLTTFGGKVTKTINKNLTHLILGHSRSSKMSAEQKKAEDLNNNGAAIQIVDQDQFYKLTQLTVEEFIELAKSPAGRKELAWISKNYNRFPNFDGADLRGLNLDGLHFGTKVIGADLRGASLRDSYGWFGNCNLEGVDFAKADIHSMTDCRAVGVDFRTIKGPWLEVDGSDLCDANFEKTMIYPHGKGVIARRSNWIGSKSSCTNLEGGDFGEARMADSNWERSEFTDMKFNNVDWRDADLHETRFLGCDLTGAKLQNANVRDVVFEDCRLDGADFTGAIVTGLKLNDTDASKAIGLDLDAAKAHTVAGPHLKALDALVKQCATLHTEAMARHGKRDVKLTITCRAKYPTFASDRMLAYAREFLGATIDLEFVHVKASGLKMPRKEAEQIVIRAWYEAFGQDLPAEDVADDSKKNKRAKKEELREKLIAGLRTKNGVKVWNKNHAQRAVLRIDLAKADLSGCDLSEIHMHHTDASETDFEKATLENSHAVRGKFTKANLKSARCAGSNFNHATFTAADVSGADMSKVHLIQANFKNAHCKKTDFRGADLMAADLCGADLTGAIFDNKTRLHGAKYDENTKFPAKFMVQKRMKYKGQGKPPSERVAAAPKPKGPLDAAAFMTRLEASVNPANLAKALKMLKAERFRLYANVADDHLVGVVKSQTDPDLVYSCKLASDGNYSCCTQNLNICGGLRGSLCKHLLVLIVGLTKANELEPDKVDNWVGASRNQKAVLDKDAMSETFLKYKGAEAGEVDWRPTETIPEDYYAM